MLLINLLSVMAQTGQILTLSLSNDGGTTYTDVGCMRRKALTMTRETIDTACDDSPDWRTTIGTQRAWSIEGEVVFEYDDPGQIALAAAYLANADYKYRVTSGITGQPVWEGDGIVTNISIEGATNEVVTRTVQIQGNGTLTEGTVAP